MKCACSFSFVKLMQSCSKEFFLKFSKPKMSKRPMKRSALSCDDLSSVPFCASFSWTTIHSKSSNRFASLTRLSCRCTRSPLT